MPIASFFKFVLCALPAAIFAQEVVETDIMTYLVDNGFNNFAGALTTAGISDPLLTKANITVFAPTDAAFVSVPLELLSGSNLLNMLLHHIFEQGLLFTADIESGDVTEADTAFGEPLTLSFDAAANSVIVNSGDPDEATVSMDVLATNGIIHVIDAVLIPDLLKPQPELPNLLDVFLENDLLTIKTAFEAAGIAGALIEKRNITVFAPTDEAFDALPAGVMEFLLANVTLLQNTLLHHVVEVAAVTSDQITSGAVLTADVGFGEDITFTVQDGKVIINQGDSDQSLIIKADIMSSSGPVHVIDTVLVSEEIAPLLPKPDVVDVLNKFGLTTLIAALDAASIDGPLITKQDITVFAPTNEAFSALTQPVLDFLLADATLLKNVLLHHIVEVAAVTSDMIVSGAVTTLDVGFGEDVPIVFQDPEVILNIDDVDEANVIQPDLVTLNGPLHIIDAVLIPDDVMPLLPVPNIVDVLKGRGLTTLVTAFEAAGISEALNAKSNITVFAPTNEAFARLPVGQLDFLLANQALLTDFLLHHVIEVAPVEAADIVSGDVTLLDAGFGEDIPVLFDGENVLLNPGDDDQASVIVADIMTVNGPLHIIDTVLVSDDIVPSLPIPNIVDVLVAMNLTTLLTAFTTSGVDQPLVGKSNITVFAPTDEAFNALPFNYLEFLLANENNILTNFLLHHVVEVDVIEAADIVSGDVTVLDAGFGEDIPVVFDGMSVILNKGMPDMATVVKADLVTINGPVHIIDGVLVADEIKPLLPSATMVDLLVKKGLTTLLDAINLTPIGPAIVTKSDITLFAPTNEAFEAVPAAALEVLLANATLLTDVLLHHIVEVAAITSADIVSGKVTSLDAGFGEDIPVVFDAGSVFLNKGEADQATVTVADVITTNGPVHVIDTVLIPDEVKPFLPLEVDVVTYLTNNGFTTLVSAFQTAGIADALASKMDITVFAPTNEAFDALPDGALDTLLADPTGLLTNALLHHVIEVAALEEEKIELGVIVEAQPGFGEVIPLSFDGTSIILNAGASDQATVVKVAQTSNGPLFVIDTVLLADDVTAALTDDETSGASLSLLARSILFFLLPAVVLGTGGW